MINPNPIISVIVPVYNAEKYLCQCLDSIINQTFEAIEILCVDDGSTDSSLAILNRYASKDDRIKVFSQKNSGPAKARNVGLENSCGDYIMFCDADDTYEPNMCEEMYRTINDKNVDVVMCNISAFDKNIRFCNSGYYFPFKEGTYQVTDLIKEKTNVYLWNKIFRRSLIDMFRMKFPDGHKSDDNAFIYQYLMASKSIYFLDVKCYNHYECENSIMDLYRSDGIKIEDVYDKVDIMLFVYRFLQKNNLVSLNKICFSNLFYNELFYAWQNLPNRWISLFLKRVATVIDTIGVENFEYEDIEKRLLIDKLKEEAFFSVQYFLDLKILQAGKVRRKFVGEGFPEPAFSEKVVPVVFNCDSNFVKYFSVALQSLVENITSEFNYDIVILNNDISEQQQDTIIKYYEYKKNVSIRFYNMNILTKSFNIDKLKTVNHVKLAAYYRLFIPTIFQHYNKVVYLDSDIILKNDISQLFKTNIDDVACAAVKDVFVSNVTAENELYFKGFYEYSKTVLGITDLKKYFNSGVMLFNIKKCLREDYQIKFMDVAQRNNKYFNDQNVLNAVLQNDVKFLDINWNVQLNFTCPLVVLNMNEFSNLHILHFCSRFKPWQRSFEERYDDIWWKYARKSPFYEIILRDFLTGERESQFRQIFTYRKDKLKYLRYKILSKITFGKMRKHYKRKKKELKMRLKEIKRLLK
ncbi:MAG: glycosyltransferase [Alphaproteobacteria bacterium]|nr:glycosyltransferase [Alphaproteobacteria bacterium]